MVQWPLAAKELGKERSVAAGFQGIPHIPVLSKSSRNKQHVPLPLTETHLPSHLPRVPIASICTLPPSVALLEHAAKTKQPLLSPLAPYYFFYPTGRGWPQRGIVARGSAAQERKLRAQNKLQASLWIPSSSLEVSGFKQTNGETKQEMQHGGEVAWGTTVG